MFENISNIVRGGGGKTFACITCLLNFIYVTYEFKIEVGGGAANVLARLLRTRLELDNLSNTRFPLTGREVDSYCELQGAM